MGCHAVLFLRLVEEREGDEGNDESGCQPLTVQDSIWSKTSVLAMSLSRNISFRNKALLSGRIDKAHVLKWFVCLIFNRINPLLILVLRVFLSDSVFEVGVEAVLGGYGGGCDSTTILLVFESSF